MHIVNVGDVPAATTDHGETIFETVGRSAGAITGHSLAQIVLPPGSASLKHYHPIAEETYHILSGEGEVEIDGAKSAITPGDSIFISPGAVHQIANTGATNLIFLAICVPAWTPDNSVFVD